MQLYHSKPSIVQLQALVWTSVYLIIFFSLLPMDGFIQATVYTLINTLFYALIIYGNIFYLYPTFYSKGYYAVYGVLVITLLLFTGVLRGYIFLTVYNHFFTQKPQSLEWKNFINFIAGGFLIFILSFVFRIAIEYFRIKQETEAILIQKSQAELNLLKSQVQPHFLFNTLNNIYYEAYREAPRTAALIERLSFIMRYLVEESPKDRVLVAAEVQFLENYIALEKIRIRHGVIINFVKDFTPGLTIPPMLLMTFVENIFKHGIDKSNPENQVEIVLRQQDAYLIFETKNTVYHHSTVNDGGFGLINLRKRLSMLYPSDFELTAQGNDHHYTSYLKIPLK